MLRGIDGEHGHVALRRGRGLVAIARSDLPAITAIFTTERRRVRVVVVARERDGAERVRADAGLVLDRHATWHDRDRVVHRPQLDIARGFDPHVWIGMELGTEAALRGQRELEARLIAMHARTVEDRRARQLRLERAG